MIKEGGKEMPCCRSLTGLQIRPGAGSANWEKATETGKKKNFALFRSSFFG